MSCGSRHRDVLQYMALMKVLMRPSLLEVVDPKHWSDPKIQEVIQELKRGNSLPLNYLLGELGCQPFDDEKAVDAIARASVAQSKTRQIRDCQFRWRIGFGVPGKASGFVQHIAEELKHLESLPEVF